MTWRSLTVLVLFLTIIAIFTVSTITYAQTFDRELSMGMSGPDVFALQTFLAQDKTLYPQGLVSGYFGFLTKAAVSNFQSRNGLPPVGRVGPMTLPVLNQQVAGGVTISTASVDNVVAAPVTNTVNPTESVALTSATTLVVLPVPLLSGGVAQVGTSIPVAYLQITSTGGQAVVLKGFWVKQNGSASNQSVANLTVIDDKDNLIGQSEVTPLKNGQAFVPASITIAPGQTRLFTIRASVAANIQADLGKQLMIDVTSIEAVAPIKGSFPIRGTTWTIN